MKESSDGETLIAVGIWFQICEAARQKHDVHIHSIGNWVNAVPSTARRAATAGA